MKARIPCIAILALGLSACAGSGEFFGSRDKVRDGYTYDTRCSSCGTVERIVASPGAPARPQAGALAGGGLVAAALTASDSAPAASHGPGTYSITVRTDDGRRVVLEQRALAGLREGARVVLRDGRARLM